MYPNRGDGPPVIAPNFGAKIAGYALVLLLLVLLLVP